MTAKPGTWRRWSDLTAVERVGLYTRQSLYVVLWAYSGLVLLVAAEKVDDHGQAVALVAGGAAVTALGFAAAVSVLHRLPEGLPPLRVGRLAPLVVVSGVYLTVAATSWTGDARDAAVAAVVASLTLPVGLVPGRRVVLVLLVLAGLLFGIVGGEGRNVIAGVLLAGGFLFTARVSLWILRIVTDLDVARRAQAQLAVAEERLRFSRDVHDVLGRRLSTIAVQAELAATLAERGDARAAERMLEVRGVAHEALREAREMARGYRPTDFLNELDGARSLLRSADIDVQLSVETLPPAWREAAAWVVRESVTNVLRHSDATVVVVAYAGGRLTVANDGVSSAGASDGSGLRGLRERLAPLGASLVARPDGDDRWIVVAQLPDTGPMTTNNRVGLPA